MKLKRLASAVLAVVMVGVNVFNGIIPVLADENDPTIKNPDPVTLKDGVKLYKTVKSVPGYANKWEVTLRIESPKTEKTSDTVIVIDRSGSMGDDGRLDAAKTAANSLAQQLLPEGNTTNRVAVVSFASSASTGTDFTTSYGTVSRVINGMRASGGTYTQSAIHMAADLLANSTADIKTMILLSDGEPTYSVSFTSSARNNNDNFVAYGGELETSSEVEQSVFNYSDTGSVGSGGALRSCIGRTDFWGNCLSGKYYNHGNSAIAEAGYFKDSNNGTLYTIALDAGDVGTPILNAIASPDKHYTATPSELTRIFNDIGGSILSLIQSASVQDTMGHGVTVSGTGGTSIEWTPEFKLEGNVFVAETSYQVEMDESVYEQTPEDGFYALNKSAVLTYNDNQKGEFPIPKAKPFALNVEKELVIIDEDGNKTTRDDEEYEFKISGSDKTYKVSSGGHNIVKVPMPIKIGTEYTITETGAVDESEMRFENYLVEYTGNKFTITENHGDEIDIKIKNTYAETRIEAHKTWDDDNDRDGLRKNYNDLAVAVKDGNKYVAYETLDLSAKDKDYSFENLPKYRNSSEINYEVVEARGCSGSGNAITCRSEFSGDTSYTVTNKDSVITNKHIPDTVTLTLKKKWDTTAGTLPTVTPEFVTVEVSNDKNDTVETVTLQGESYTEWTGTFTGFKNEAGQKINYTVTEKKIDNSSLNANNTLYVYSGDVLEGKWVATREGMEVTNTWTPAKSEYTGVGEFTIKKLDQDNEALSGVTFTVGDKTYTTGSDGTVKVDFSKSTDKPKDKYTFNVTETDAPEFYDIIAGTEVLEATTHLDLKADEEGLINKYTKSFGFTVKTAVDGYVWQNNDLTLLVTDQALADELKIEKTFEGISAEAFEEKSQIKFTVSGPKGFTEMTVGNGDEACEISGSKLICTIDGSETLLPVGEYTVTEKDADITNFTYTSEPTSKEIKKTVALGGTAEFKFKNVYEPVKTASFKVKKIWEDDSDRDGIRPDELEVTLLADGEAYGDPVELIGDDWEYEWTELPLVNEDAEVIEYSAEEEDLGDDYESDGGKMKDGVFTFTNTHEPEKYNITGELTVKKIWEGEGVDLVRPDFVVVDLLANGEVIKTESIIAGQNNEWTHTFTDLYKNADGEEIVYSVQESAIGETAFGENESTIVVYKADGKTLDGKWVKSIEEFEVTNTWTPATMQIDYDGESEFIIKKVDEDYKPLSGVTFEINDGEEKTKEETDRSGVVTVEVPVTTTDEDGDNAKTEESFEYEVSEYEAKEGYDEVEGSATVGVTCTSTLAADPDTLVNYYTKTCTFEKTDGSDKFVWDGEDLTLTVVNKRSMAQSLVITKAFSGVNVNVLKDVTFAIEGPEDFGDNGTMTLTVGNDCTSSEDKIVCEVDAKIPTGEYTVTESNAEIEFFTLNVSGDNGKEKTVKKNDEVEFKINNEYVVDTTYFDVIKIWEDEHNKDGSRPETLKVNLLANGETVDTKELSAENEIEDEELPEDLEKSDIWVHTFEGLPVADENAEVIEYYAEEELDIDGYEQIDEIGGMHTVIFVNMHEPVDPCDEGGCGGIDTTPVEAPETGKLIKSENSGAREADWLNNMIGGGIALLGGAMMIVFSTRRKGVKLTK